ncbi:MAG: aspartyl protease family protein [Daejeonella sp.]|uniref:aspartyl protease family protein n=1 Tax=Daejeonella sp. TaxID=2805397 RepID=UPI00273429F9|nr:aspartyl protease family protein [Daejeonella sp.]MDP3467142.1 aspartyl protease family protein [Daejeonella sp.]
MIKNQMVIQLHINGKGPFNFILDTGVGLVLISDPKLVDSVSFQNLRSIYITGFGEGEKLSALIAPSIDIRIGNTFATNISAAILKKDIFELSNYVGIPIHGLIGYEFFHSFVVRLNFSSSTITVFQPQKTYIPKRGSRIPLSIEERKPYITTNIQLKSGKKLPVKLVIDTGAGHAISLETIDGVPFELPDERIRGNLGVGLTGPIDGYIGRIASLQLGKYTLNNVIAAFPDHEDAASRIFSINRNGNMGITIINRFNIVFDYNRAAMYIKPLPTFKEAFEHDMAGMEIGSAGENYKRLIITRVEPSSAAEQAGLMRGDEILAINFRAVSEMSLSEIDAMFRSRNGRSFVIDILSNETKIKERLILTLIKRI